MAAARPLVLGVSTSSFRDLPRVTGRDNVDDVIRALKAVGATHIELALANVEPAPPSTAPFMGGSPAYPRRIVFTPEQIAATNAVCARGAAGVAAPDAASVFEAVRGKFAAAGITVHACSLAYDDSFTDDEIEATFRQVKALGVTTDQLADDDGDGARASCRSPSGTSVTVAIHNQVDGNPPGAIATPELKDALALSPAFTLKLDIGNLTASNCDAVAELREHQSRVSHVLVRDRLRNGGTSQHFGEGDTPIAAVLERARRRPRLRFPRWSSTTTSACTRRSTKSTALAYVTRSNRTGRP